MKISNICGDCVLPTEYVSMSLELPCKSRYSTMAGTWNAGVAPPFLEQGLGFWEVTTFDSGFEVLEYWLICIQHFADLRVISSRVGLPKDNELNSALATEVSLECTSNYRQWWRLNS